MFFHLLKNVETTLSSKAILAAGWFGPEDDGLLMTLGLYLQ